MKTRQDYLDLLEDTVRYYSDTSKRAISKNFQGREGEITCVYLDSKTKNACAVGRHMIPGEHQYHLGDAGDLAKNIIGGEYGQEHGHWDYNEALDSVLKEEYRGYEFHFWDKLQYLHDTERYWHSQGLTSLGDDYVAEIKSWINENIPIESDSQ